MRDSVLGEAIADQIFRNREAGWLTHAIEVLEAGPHLRRRLLSQLRHDVRESLSESLPGHDVADNDLGDGWWFLVDVAHAEWGEFRIGLCNWKWDASQVGIGVYNPQFKGLTVDEIGAKVPKAMVSRIKEAMKPGVWTGTRIGREFVTNVSMSPSDWSAPSFLLGVANRRLEVVNDVRRQVMNVVGQVDALLRECAEGRPTDRALHSETGPSRL